MRKNSNTYWYCQIIGWSVYILLNMLFSIREHSGLQDYLIYILFMAIGIGITHLYRLVVIHFNILELKIPAQLLFIAFFSVVLAVTFFFHTYGMLILFGIIKSDLSLVIITRKIIDYTVPFLIWNIIYFGFKYFQNYRRSEINSLRYLAASRESELNSLKAQLNPHFMFNSLNSIRALIDENPLKAKEAVTQLSGILRNTLLMNKSRLIPLYEEINLVKDYLNLELIRYEERLNYEIVVDPDLDNTLIPPFIIQSQVENAIKHGISRRPGKGNIRVEVFALAEILKIKVSNTGRINTEKPLTGVGFKNSIQRLELLYGAAGKIFINEVNDLVVVDINIPLRK